MPSSKNLTLFNVFVASPGDLTDERKRIKTVAAWLKISVDDRAYLQFFLRNDEPGEKMNLPRA